MAGEERVAAYLNTLHQAAEVPFDVARPIRFYVRSADSVFKQACIYKAEGDLEKAFILFLKYSKYVATTSDAYQLVSSSRIFPSIPSTHWPTGKYRCCGAT